MTRIMNMTSVSINIGDIGVHLQPIGGANSFAIVRSDVIEQSTDIKNYEKSIRLEEFEIVYPGQIQTDIVQHDNVYIFQDEQNVKCDDKELNELRTLIEEMKLMQNEFLNVVKNAVLGQPVNVNVNVVNNTEISRIDEPIILSGSILPDSVKSSIKSDDNNIGSNNYNSTLNALKKLKKLV